MNIYLHVESVIRELDSKLLLAVLAASKGHQVIVSNLSSLIRGMRVGLLPPGIFHTKSLTPAEDKILRHQKIIDNNFVITSIDEEGGLVDYGYDKFAKIRYSDKTISQCSAVFGWGYEDVDTLKKKYTKHSTKIYRTGSPRADLWKPIFSNYWGIPKVKPKKPFLLISSNLGLVNNKKTPFKVIEWHKRVGYYQRDPELIYKHLSWIADESRMMHHYVSAIKYITKNNNLYDIVLRPHPTENIDLWKIFLDGLPNVHVIGEGSITSWVNHSFAVLHNGCTTSLEATISGKPVITYVPFKQVFNRGLANDLGKLVSTEEELLTHINKIFNDSQIGDLTNKKEKIPNELLKKVFLDENELAADKIVKVWESIDNQNLSQSFNLLSIKFFLKLMKVRDGIKKKMLNFFSTKHDKYKKNEKFPSLNIDDINERIFKLQSILKSDQNLECKFLSDKTFLIKQK